MIGEHLFLDTYDVVRSLGTTLGDAGSGLPIIASGGVVDVGKGQGFYAQALHHLQQLPGFHHSVA